MVESVAFFCFVDFWPSVCSVIFSVFGFVGLTRGKKVSVLSIISAPALRLFGLMYLPPKAGPRPFPFGIVIFNERSRG